MYKMLISKFCFFKYAYARISFDIILKRRGTDIELKKRRTIIELKKEE